MRKIIYLCTGPLCTSLLGFCTNTPIFMARNVLTCGPFIGKRIPPPLRGVILLCGQWSYGFDHESRQWMTWANAPGYANGPRCEILILMLAIFWEVSRQKLTSAGFLVDRTPGLEAGGPASILRLLRRRVRTRGPRCTRKLALNRMFGDL